MLQFSVIVPVYNVENYIGRCIDSILEQTFVCFELILVDDGSTDRSLEICNHYASIDKRIKLIHQENRGVSAARNVGLYKAAGKYIVFVDGDDVVEKTFLYCMAQIDEKIDLVIGGSKQISIQGKVDVVRQYNSETMLYLTRENILQMIENHSIDYVWAKRYRTEIIKRKTIFFDESLDLGEDTYFVACYLNECKSVQYIETIAYHYFKYSHNTLSSFNSNSILRSAKANRKISDVLEKKIGKISDTEIWEKRIYNDFSYNIFHILKNKSWRDIEKYQYLKSIFGLEEFKAFSKNLNLYMNKESKIIRSIISTKSPLIVLIFWRLLEMKNTLKSRNVEKM